MFRRPLIASLFACLVLVTVHADNKAFLGRWNLTGTGDAAGNVYWLEVKDEGGKLSGMFLNRGGSPVALPEINIDNDQLVCRVAGAQGKPGPEHRAKLEGGKLTGTTTTPQGATINWVGVRPPEWKAANSSGSQPLGKPVDLSTL